MHVLNQKSPVIGATVLLIRGHQAGAPIQSLEVHMSPATPIEVSQMLSKLHDTSYINIRATPSARNDKGKPLIFDFCSVSLHFSFCFLIFLSDFVLRI